MKDSIDKAPDAIRRNYTTRLYTTRDENRPSMAAGVLAAMDYAKTCHFDAPRPQPVFGVIAAKLQASNDVHAFRLFCTEHGDELRLEQEAERRWLANREWAKGPNAAAVAAHNQAAYQADQLEIEIQHRTRQIMSEREFAERARAVADARKELTR